MGNKREQQTHKHHANDQRVWLSFMRSALRKLKKKYSIKNNHMALFRSICTNPSTQYFIPYAYFFHFFFHMWIHYFLFVVPGGEAKKKTNEQFVSFMSQPQQQSPAIELVAAKIYIENNRNGKKNYNFHFQIIRFIVARGHRTVAKMESKNAANFRFLEFR